VEIERENARERERDHNSESGKIRGEVMDQNGERKVEGGAWESEVQP
jgi:hypothetical protein